VLFHCLFVYLLAGFYKNYSTYALIIFGGRVAHGLQKNPLDFGGPDHITLGL